MSCEEEHQFIIALKDISVESCRCYVDYWRSLRKQLKECSVSVIKFDYSIEKVKSYRKFFHDDRTLFHFCIDCFARIMRSVPFSLVEFEIRFRRGGGCIASVLLGNDLPENVCNSCINFVIDNFSKDDFITV